MCLGGEEAEKQAAAEPLPLKPGASLALSLLSGCNAAAPPRSGLAVAELEGGAAGLTGREAIADRDGSPARPGVGEGRG